MIIKRKLRSLLKKIHSGAFSNEELLVEAHKKLENLLDSPLTSEVCIERIKAIKLNEIYKLFKLAEDPYLLKSIISKISDYKVLEKILNSSDIVYSLNEKIVLTRCLNILLLLDSLEADLKEVVEFSKEEMYEEEFFFGEHFKELGILKTVFSSDFISVDDIEWFFNTDLFDFIAAEPENFSSKLTDIYQLMLQDVKLTGTEDFNKQRQILLDKKTKEGSVFNYGAFSSILSDTRRKATNYLNRNLDQTNSASFFKRRKICTNPLPQRALENNLDVIGKKHTY